MPDQNNIPTDDMVFEPMEGSEIPSIIADVLLMEASPYAEDDPIYPVERLVMNTMKQQRRHLTAILELCRNNPSMDEVKAEFDRVWEFSPCVYTAYDLCVLLEECGGITCVDAEGNPYNTSGIEPIIYEDEIGARYYKANEPADMHWSTTEAGIGFLEGDDPLSRAQKAFDADPDLLCLYRRVLKLCEGEGKSIVELEQAVDYDSLVQNPSELIASNDIYVEFFVGRLEDADCIEWKGTWQTTEVGRQALELLADVEDSYDYKAAEKGQLTQ